MKISAQNALLGLSLQELTGVASELGEPAYRGHQLYQAIYAERKTTLAEVTTLPQSLRKSLEEKGFSVEFPRIEKQFTSNDGTIRYLLGFCDSESVETVWMPEGDGGESGDGTEAGEDAEPAGWQAGRFHRATICVSSQVGCAVDCQFCMTALLGLKRNLSAGEIVGQVLAVLNERGVDVE